MRASDYSKHVASKQLFSQSRKHSSGGEIAGNTRIGGPPPKSQEP
jgi:hypothetical protein